MNRIEIQESRSYHAPAISDIITMIPLMDNLAYELRQSNKIIKNSEEGQEVSRELMVEKSNLLYEQLTILSSIGFTTSKNNKDIETPQEIRI